MKEKKKKNKVSSQFPVAVTVICLLSIFTAVCCAYLTAYHRNPQIKDSVKEQFDFLYQVASTKATGEATTDEVTTEVQDSVNFARLMCVGNNTIYKSIYNEAYNKATESETPEPTSDEITSETPETSSEEVTYETSETSSQNETSETSSENETSFSETETQSTQSTQRYDFSGMYENLEKIINQSDTALVNMTGTLTTDGEVYAYPDFCMPSESAQALYDIGFRVFSYGNPHCLDNGQQGIEDTVGFYNNLDDALYTGIYRDETDYEYIRIQEVNGIKIAYLSFTETTDGHTLEATDTGIVINLDAEGEEIEAIYTKIKELIKVSKEQADFTVVTMGFSNTGSSAVSSSQRSIVNYLVSFGADVVIGEGISVIQPMETITRDDGTKAVVAFSLGNLITAEEKKENMLGGVADIVFSKNAKTGEKSIVYSKIIPIVTYYESNYQNFSVIRLGDLTQEQSENHALSGYSGFGFDYAVGQFDEIIGADYVQSDVKSLDSIIETTSANQVTQTETGTAQYGVNIEESTARETQATTQGY